METRRHIKETLQKERQDQDRYQNWLKEQEQKEIDARRKRTEKAEADKELFIELGLKDRDDELAAHRKIL